MFRQPDDAIAVIVENREEAIVTMRRALDEFVVEGIKTNLPLHRRILRHGVFIDGDYDTSFLVTHLLKR